MNYNSPDVKSKNGSEKESDGVNEDEKEKEDTIMELTAPFPMSRYEIKHFAFIALAV